MDLQQALCTAQGACLFTLVVYAAIRDVKVRRIPTRAVLAGFLAGVVLQAVRGVPFGPDAVVGGLAQSAAGAVAGGGIFFALYWLGGFGAGDAKLMAAVGALTSWRFVLWAVVYTAVAGAVLALAVLIKHGGWRGALRRAAKSTRSERRAAVSRADPATTVPYAVAICVGCVWAAGYLIVRDGVWPW